MHPAQQKAVCTGSLPIKSHTSLANSQVLAVNRCANEKHNGHVAFLWEAPPADTCTGLLSGGAVWKHAWGMGVCVMKVKG